MEFLSLYFDIFEFYIIRNIDATIISAFNMYLKAYYFYNKGFRDGDFLLQIQGVSQIIPLLCHKLDFLFKTSVICV